MTETIPADVMAEAQKQTAWLRDNEEEHGELHDRVISLVIARAILSERDRCAKICDGIANRLGQMQSDAASADAADECAAAIRNPMEGRE